MSVVGAQTFEVYPEQTFEYVHAYVRFPICHCLLLRDLRVSSGQ